MSPPQPHLDQPSSETTRPRASRWRSLLPAREFSSQTLAKQAPLAKLAIWVAGVFAVATLFQSTMWMLGLELSIFDKNVGSAVLIASGLGFLLMLMAVDERPLAEYGVVADRDWFRRAATGLAIGAGVYICYSLALWFAGVLVLRPEATSPARIAKALLAGFSSGPIAVTQQIIFSGYLLGMLRTKHSRWFSVLLPATLFALVTGASSYGGLTAFGGQRLFVGMLLLATLLGLLRLRTGSIVLPAGLLAGCILIRKLSSKSRLVGFDWNNPDAWWLAPMGDPRQGIALWLLLAVAIGAVACSLYRNGERQITSDADSDASFKQIMPFSNLLGMAPIDRWVVLLWQARFRIGLKYLPRLVVTLIASAVNTMLALPERIIAPVLLRKLMRNESPAPLFIVGMNRSGTTHLHNLLSLDPQFRSPRNYEAFNPHGFLTGWLTTAVLTPFMTWRRPMDSVQMTILSSQEDEFALATMGSPSPYWSFCLPKEIARHDRYLQPEGFTPSQRRRWESHYRLFLQKLTCFNRRTPLLKNPANTGRVAWLKRLFPAAKFVHIVRHPHQVYQSNKRLAKQGLVVFQLQDPNPSDNYAGRCLQNYRQMVDAFYRDTASLPNEDVAEVRYEDLDDNPLAVVESLYAQLGMTITAEFSERMQTYLNAIRGYRKNRHAELSPAELVAVDTKMGPYLQQWGYAKPVEEALPRAA